jgi:hypothetical protein
MGIFIAGINVSAGLNWEYWPHPFPPQTIFLSEGTVKNAALKDFWPLVFFIKQSHLDLITYVFEFAKLFDKIGASAVSMTPLRRYDTAGAGDLEFQKLWLPVKRISI